MYFFILEVLVIMYFSEIIEFEPKGKENGEGVY